MMANTLVAYFSASGVTARAARLVAEVTGGTLFEIAPAEPYTRADLDWTDRHSRSSLEHADESVRPAIANAVEDWNAYDTVYVGFPIWWYREPAIIDTFMETYDFSGKTAVPFCTSGGSGTGSIDARFRSLAQGAATATFKPAKLLNGMELPAVKAWVAAQA